MGKFFSLILFLFPLVFSSYGQQNPRSTNAIILDDEPEVVGTKRALIIGISKYDEEKIRLNYAHKDALLYRDYLIQNEKVDSANIIFLMDEHANSIDVGQAFEELYDITEENDEIYLYFAGHGDIGKKRSNDVGFLLLWDVNNSRNYIGTNGVWPMDDLSDLVQELATVKKAKVTLVLDACHSGYEDISNGARSNYNIVSKLEYNNTTKMLSCRADESSIESSQIGHGYFTFYLVAGLKGAADNNSNNKIEKRELEDYLEDNVRLATNNKQSPYITSTSYRYKDDVFRVVTPEEREDALAFVNHTAGELVAFNDKNKGISTKIEHYENPYLDDFNFALAENNLRNDDKSAYAIYILAKEDEYLNKSLLSKMKALLLKRLSIPAQLLINKYIDEKNIGESIELLNSAKDLEIALSLIEDHPMTEGTRKRMLVSKLFLEAYYNIYAERFSYYKESKEKLEEALNIEPNAAYIYNVLGRLYNDEEDYEKAQECYEKAIEIVPTWSYPRNNLGINYMEQYQFSKALEVYNEGEKLARNKAPIYNNKGILYRNMGNYHLAEKCYLLSIENEPTMLTYKNLGSLYSIRGDKKKSEEYYKHALAIDSTDIIKGYGVDSYVSNFKITNEEAGDLYREAIKMEPYYSKYHADYADFLRSKYYFISDSLSKSDSLYRKAIELDPYSTWPYAGRGWLFDQQNMEKEALLSFQEGVKHNPNKASAYRYIAWYYLSQIKDTTLALENDRKVLEINPYDQSALNSLIDYHKDKGDNEQAKNILQQMVEFNPMSPNNWNNLGDIYYMEKNYDKAIEMYLKALEVDDKNSLGLVNLSYSYLYKYEFEKAYSFYKKAFEVNPIQNKMSIFEDQIIAFYNWQKRIQEVKNAEAIITFAYTHFSNENISFQYLKYKYDINKDYNKNDYKELENLIENTDSDYKKLEYLKLYFKVLVSDEKANLVTLEQIYTRMDALPYSVPTVFELLYYYKLKDISKVEELKTSVSSSYKSEKFLNKHFNSKTVLILKSILP